MNNGLELFAIHFLNNLENQENKKRREVKR